MKTLLLLSGGKDSREVFNLFIQNNVKFMTISFVNQKQNTEIKGIFQTLKTADVHYEIFTCPWFNETTWSAFKLLYRDIRVMWIAIKYAKKHKCKVIATGVKPSDYKTHKWLPFAMKGFRCILKIWGLDLINPLFGGEHENHSSRQGKNHNHPRR
jgi:7-cyano-7-deazaguanine synthase in queuosine biosynthesis